MRIKTPLTLIAGLALALPAGAAAHPKAPKAKHVYPVASRLCAAVDRGHTPQRLAGSEAEVAQACADLRAAYTAATTDLQSSVASLRDQLVTARATAKDACKAARANGDHAACQDALTEFRATLTDLNTQLKAAIVSYRDAIGTARETFWTAIRALPGGATIRPDRPAFVKPPRL